MRVVKMRGSAHETHPYRLKIGAGGIQVARWAADDHRASVEAAKTWNEKRS
jgi:hypothetical protein